MTTQTIEQTETEFLNKGVDAGMKKFCMVPSYTKENLSIASLADKSIGRGTEGILVTETETVVTDGHMMLIVEAAKVEKQHLPIDLVDHAASSFEPFILPAKQAVEAGKAIPKTPMSTLSRAFVSEVGEKRQWSTYDLEAVRSATFRPVESTYPNWQAVVPVDSSTDTEITFNLSVLVPLLKAMQGVVEKDSKGDQCVTFRIRDNSSAMRIDGRVSEKRATTGVIMPFRDNVNAHNWNKTV